MNQPVAITDNTEVLRSRLEHRVREIRPLRAVNYTNNWMDVIAFFNEVGQMQKTFETVFCIQLKDGESASDINQLEALFRESADDWLLGVFLSYFYFTVLQDTERCSAVMSQITNLTETPLVCQAISDRLEVLHQGHSGQPDTWVQRQEVMLHQRLQAFMDKHGRHPDALLELVQAGEEQTFLEELARFWTIAPESGQILFKEHVDRNKKASERHQRMSRVVRHQPTCFEQPDNQ